LNDSELELWGKGLLQAAPYCLLLNKKGNSSSKARLVCLGDRWVPDSDNSTSLCASAASAVGNRVVLTKAAREPHAVIPCDIGNAFLRASIGGLEVCVAIPPSFRDQNDPTDSGHRLLLRALCGLPISPRLWQRALHRGLLDKPGWALSPHEPGACGQLNKDTDKLECSLSVYADDCLCAAITPERAEEEVT
jgi:hypothetical protein